MLSYSLETHKYSATICTAPYFYSCGITRKGSICSVFFTFYLVHYNLIVLFYFYDLQIPAVPPASAGHSSAKKTIPSILVDLINDDDDDGDVAVKGPTLKRTIPLRTPLASHRPSLVSMTASQRSITIHQIIFMIREPFEGVFIPVNRFVRKTEDIEDSVSGYHTLDAGRYILDLVPDRTMSILPSTSGHTIRNVSRT